MKAIVKAKPEQGLWLQDVPIPVPMHIGHEFVGTIEKVGAHVKDFKPGDLVSGEGHLICGHCRNCLAGRRHLCVNTKGVGVNRPEAYAQYLAIPVTNVWYCNKNIPLIDVTKQTIEQAQKDLGMKEGFDVAMEISGNPSALTSILDNMCHGGKIALLGIMPDNTDIDWNKVVFNMLTIKGIYGREMYETWYKMTSMIQTGLDISPLITHKFHYTQFEKRFEIMRSGQSGKVILDWN